MLKEMLPIDARARFALHEAQREIHGCHSRFRVVSAGRRFGKTRLAVMECIEVANNGGRAWWVSPSYKMSNVGWRPLRKICSRIPVSYTHLRAHETVLDIVCRLLLENKNIKIDFVSPY